MASIHLGHLGPWTRATIAPSWCSTQVIQFILVKLSLSQVSAGTRPSRSIGLERSVAVTTTIVI
jgi:hypothetical protein